MEAVLPRPSRSPCRRAGNVRSFSSMEQRARERQKLLIVDDDQAALESLRQIFEREAFEVSLAQDGQEALEKVRKEDVSVVLADLRMPGMDGMELLKGLKAIRPEVEVVIMTAFGTIEKAVEAMREGAYDFVTKPLRRPLVVRSVTRAGRRLLSLRRTFV